MVSLLGRDDRGVGAEHKVDAGVWHQVSLELSHIHVEGTIEAQGSRQGADDLSNQAVQVGVGRALDVEAAAANVINSLVVEHDRHIGVLQQGVGRQDGVVWLNNSRRHLGRRVDSEAQLGLLAVVDRQALQQQRAKARASAATNSVENEEALQAGAVVGQLADTVQSEIHNFLADGVVTTGEVVGGILFAGNQLLRVEQLAVGAGADLVHDGRLQVQEDAAWHVLASTSLREEGVEGVVASANCLVRRHLTVRLNTMLQAIQLPAGIADLNTGLADMDGDDLTHGCDLG
ncbi:hypothetical protein Vretimale_4897 [Volvox reticuliferus]|uniref:Uncharacterized protein n=1 Tax=Volvox reticuliferus TaxID=1737510 RepID=A0A8J4DD06_9CHLO|nr:hypothetical protein Vretimale_4897 [Volvox reticuliferus]